MNRAILTLAATLTLAASSGMPARSAPPAAVAPATTTAATSGAAASAAPAAGDPARGRQRAYTCLGCHGIESYENAYPMYRVPKLAGQHADYIVAALQGYRDGDRSHATMHAQASSLSDADMRDIGAYLASLGGGASAAGVAAAPLGTAPAAGQVCTACHGANGIAITDAYPSLAGQYADYIRRALAEYRQGGRKNPVMMSFASTLKDEDIAALAAYYSQQRPVLGTLPRPWSILASARD